MSLTEISLNVLRAFDASARHLNFTSASKELFVTQAAIAHQVKALEDYIEKPLFNRLARGLALTDAGANLAPIIAKSLEDIGNALEMIKGDARKEVLHIGVVGTFAIGFLMPRLDDFHAKHPDIKIRLHVNNNVPDLLNEHLDFAIRFGEGAWHSLRSHYLMKAPMTPLCSPKLAAQIKKPEDLANFELLRSYRKLEWAKWFGDYGIRNIQAQGPIFDNSRAIGDAAAIGIGIGLLPYKLFKEEVAAGKLVRPFEQCVEAGSYYLTHLVQNPMNDAMNAFADWIMNECAHF